MKLILVRHKRSSTLLSLLRKTTSNYVLLFLNISLFASCQEKTAENNVQVIGYEADTVIIDSKDRVLDLRGNMMTSNLDNEGISFFMYNHFDHSIDEIDLDKQVFINNFPLETEGPNGVGEILFGIQVLYDSLFFTKSYFISALIDQNGQIVRRIDWEGAKDSSGIQIEQLPRRYEVISDTEDLNVFGLNHDVKNRKVSLDVFSLNDNTVNRLEIDPANSFKDFFLRFDDHRNKIEPFVYLTLDSNYVLISHEYSNEILLFSKEGEFVKVVHYEPQLTPKRAETPAGPEFKSKDQVSREYQFLLEQVRFEAPVWDKEKNRYYRLSSKRIFEDQIKEESEISTIIKSTNVFLSVFDAEFNLISEMKIDELDDERIKHFAKDGKLWIAQNFSDELGFLTLDIKP